VRAHHRNGPDPEEDGVETVEDDVLAYFLVFFLASADSNGPGAAEQQLDVHMHGVPLAERFQTPDAATVWAARDPPSGRSVFYSKPLLYGVISRAGRPISSHFGRVSVRAGPAGLRSDDDGLDLPFARGLRALPATGDRQARGGRRPGLPARPMPRPWVQCILETLRCVRGALPPRASLSPQVAERPNFVLEPWHKQRLTDLKAVELPAGPNGGAALLVLIFDAAETCPRWTLLAANTAVRARLLSALQAAWKAVFMVELPVHLSGL
jgi:hypothetical protein